MAPASPLNLPATGNSAKQDDGLKIIHAGLYRTATGSMAKAYRILGYNAQHALEDLWNLPWVRLEQAAEATWPHLANLPGYTFKSEDGTVRPRPPFTRADWQTIWGEFDVATDMASPFVLELIKAYPDAKVVIVQREFESWWPSFESRVISQLYDPMKKFFVWRILGMRSIHTMEKIHAGFFSADEYSKKAIELRAKDAYEEYYRKVREAVPLESGRRLDYTMGSGWEPLCEFLGKDVPDVEFPRVNDSNSHKDDLRQYDFQMYTTVLLKVGPLVALVVGVAVIYSRW
ncbi:hypothetical protein FSARC_3032 [Fusarium sarcochroum]|uniref:Efflux pump antibiotic resistance protein n=1 Tax=Fusarium sarcochroum TaxID=1208366 RepID=A0A8H4U552_9HYPO|nr:hypothetical protein FSARC_3032 [Fusarium sarcochroum]